MGGGLGRKTARASRCGHHLCAGGRACAGGSGRGAQGRHGGLRWDSHERHPVLPLPFAVAEASDRLGANLTRQGGIEFLAFDAQSGIKTHTKTYALEQANRALSDLREGRLKGAAVLVPPSG